MVNKAIVIRPTTVPGSIGGVQIPAFEVLLAGDFAQFQQELTFHPVETAEWNQHSFLMSELWSVSGQWSPLAADPHHYELKSPQSDDKIDPPSKVTGPIVAFAFKQGASKSDYLYFVLPNMGSVHKSGPSGITGFFEGDSWELEIHADGGNVKSPIFRIVWNAHVVPPRFNDPLSAMYDWHAGNDIKLYNDACSASNGSGSYFSDLIPAIRKAKTFIFIADWSFHASIMLTDGEYRAKNTVGALLLNKANSGVQVAILTWKHGATPKDSTNDDIGAVLAAIQQALTANAGDQPTIGPVPAPILWRADYRSLYFSHHQKFVVMDSGADRSELQVFYGGIDITKGRYDWHDHPVMANADTRHCWSTMNSGGKRYNEWYNNEWDEYGLNIEFPASNDPNLAGALADIPPREPWHDVHARLRGPVAWDFAREFVSRWQKIDSPRLSLGNLDSDSIERVVDCFKGLFDRSKFVQQWEHPPSDRRWSAQLLHSIDKTHWPKAWVNTAWSPARKEGLWNCKDSSSERSIQNSYLNAIRRAERFIYIENQYFIGSGAYWSAARDSVANSIPQALVERTQWMIQNHPTRDFHIYVNIPMAPEGATVPAIGNAYPGVRALEWQTIAYMINEVRNAAAAVNKNWDDYLSFCFLMRSDAAGENSPPPSLSYNWRDLAPLKNGRMDLCRTNQRYMVYIHCKLMIIDDRFLILGSANANERSMAGDRDTEICVAMWPSSSRVESKCESDIQGLRQRLLTEHLGGAPLDGFRAPESPGFRKDVFQARARANYHRLLAPPGDSDGNMQGHLVMLPFDVALSTSTRQAPAWFTAEEMGDDRHEYLIDSLRNHDQWKWRCDVNSVVGGAAGGSLIE
jgi:phospholipase D1/2